MEIKYKRKLFFIIMTICLCTTLLVSATFGLFTAEDTTSVHVSSATMEMDLLQANEIGEYVSIKNQDGRVFGNAVWEPNQSRVVFLMVKNNSTIKIKYSLQFFADAAEMEGSLEYCAFESKYFDSTGKSWDELKAIATPTMMRDGANEISGSSYIVMQPGEEHYYAFAVHMLPESGNEYQNKNCTFDINVFAVQGNAD
jgi:hypothetical protein